MIRLGWGLPPRSKPMSTGLSSQHGTSGLRGQSDRGFEADAAAPPGQAAPRGPGSSTSPDASSVPDALSKQLKEEFSRPKQMEPPPDDPGLWGLPTATARASRSLAASSREA